MALRDSGRARAGRRRHLPGRVRAPAARRSASSRARSAPTSRASRRTSRSIPTRSRSTPCPQVDVFLPNGYTKEEWKVVSESRKILHLPDLRVSCTAVRVPVFVAHSEAVHVETRAPIRPDRARELFAAVDGVVVQDDPSTSTYPLATDGRRLGRHLRRAGPPGPVDRGRPRPRVLGRERQPPQGRRDERGPDRGGRSSSAAGSARPRPGARRRTARRGPRSGPRRDPGRAPGGARGDRGGGPDVHPLPARRRPDERRPGRGQPRHRGRPRSARARASTRTASGRPFIGRAGDLLVEAPRLDRVAARRRLHHERREVPPAGQPRPGARRGRRLRAVPEAPARGPRPGPDRDPRPPLDGPVHAGRPDQPGPRHDRPGRSGERRPRRDGLRDVPPGRRPARRGGRAPELRGRRHGARRSCSTVRARRAAAPQPRPRRRRPLRQPPDGEPARDPRRSARPTRARAPRPTSPSSESTHPPKDEPPPHANCKPIHSGSSRSAGSARSARTCTCSSTATTSSSSTAA